jgi:hypothetical protein
LTDSRSVIARAARAKGIRAEQDLAKYLRTWWPAAERTVATGHRAGDHVREDHGDITGVPGIVWQLKYIADMSDRDIRTALDETATQRAAAGADFGILVQRRPMKANPGHWWAWMRLGDLIDLAMGAEGTFTETLYVPARIHLDEAVGLLLAAGYSGAVTA